MSGQKQYINESLEEMLDAVEGLDNAGIDAELAALGVEPGIARSSVRNAVQCAVAKRHRAGRGARIKSRVASMFGMFRDSSEPVYAGKRGARKRDSE